MVPFFHYTKKSYSPIVSTIKVLKIYMEIHIDSLNNLHFQKLIHSI